MLACDPQSPLTGGALLGDRFRMPARPDDDGVFIRSLAAAGGRAAVAERLGALIRLCEAFGFDVVLVETVGAGQGDTAMRTSWTFWCCCCNRKPATICNGRRRGCWKWPTWQ